MCWPYFVFCDQRQKSFQNMCTDFLTNHDYSKTYACMTLQHKIESANLCWWTPRQRTSCPNPGFQLVASSSCNRLVATCMQLRSTMIRLINFSNLALISLTNKSKFGTTQLHRWWHETLFWTQEAWFRLWYLLLHRHYTCYRVGQTRARRALEE